MVLSRNHKVYNTKRKESEEDDHCKDRCVTSFTWFARRISRIRIWSHIVCTFGTRCPCSPKRARLARFSANASAVVAVAFDDCKVGATLVTFSNTDLAHPLAYHPFGATYASGHADGHVQALVTAARCAAGCPLHVNPRLPSIDHNVMHRCRSIQLARRALGLSRFLSIFPNSARLARSLSNRFGVLAWLTGPLYRTPMYRDPI